MKLLYITEDRYPPFRADVVETFARQMPARGHTIDWLMQRNPESLDTATPTQWLSNHVYMLGLSMVRVLKRVRECYPRAHLIYVGEGQLPNDRMAVEQEALRLGLQDVVTVTGFLPMEQAWSHVKQADICLSAIPPIPVFLVSSPTKLIEYMAMAKCVVANDLPEQSQVMADNGVGRCIPWSEKAFTDEICRLLDDPEAARQAWPAGRIGYGRTGPMMSSRIGSRLYTNVC